MRAEPRGTLVAGPVTEVTGVPLHNVAVPRHQLRHSDMLGRPTCVEIINMEPRFHFFRLVEFRHLVSLARYVGINIRGGVTAEWQTGETTHSDASSYSA